MFKHLLQPRWQGRLEYGLEDRRRRLVKVLLAALGDVGPGGFLHQSAELDLFLVRCRVGAPVSLSPLFEMMQEDGDEGQMTVLVVVQGVNVLGHVAGELDELRPRLQQPQIRRGGLIRVRVHDGKGAREADLEVRVEPRRVYRHQRGLVPPAIVLEKGEAVLCYWQRVHDGSEEGRGGEGGLQRRHILSRR